MRPARWGIVAAEGLAIYGLLLAAGEAPTHAAVEALALVVACLIAVIFVTEGGRPS